MNDNRDDIVDDLIVRSLTGETTAEDEKELSAWIARSQDNERHYLSFKKAFDLSKSYSPDPPQQPGINIDEEWGHFLKNVGKQEVKTEKPYQAPSRTLIQESNGPGLWLRVAATIVILVGAGVIINYFISGTTMHFRTTDKTLALSLSDGSQVILNRNSELSYTSHFGSSKTRTVSLKGEAFFEVARDPDLPFIVHINDAEVEVLGTTFNVQGYDHLKEIVVTVETGIVKLSAPDLKKEVKLVAGSKGVYSVVDRQVRSLRNDNVNFLSWKTRKIVFIENDLHTVIEALNKAYGVNITILSDIPASCKVTVTFDRQSLDAVLHVLKTTLNLTYHIQGNQIEITHACVPE